jgi:peptide deformylase
MIVTDISKLTIPSKDYIFAYPIPDKQYAENLIKKMYEYKGFGLSAIQIGDPVRVFAMVGDKQDYVCFNPIIESYSNEVLEMEEGCLSFPNLILEINRAKHIRVNFQDYNGDRSIHTFTGMTARVVQHEMEHLDGELFFQGKSRLKIERAIKEAKKRGTDYSSMGLLRFAKKEK